jgi:hypothetical protein
MPDHTNGQITSITKKEFLSIVGDGQKSIEQLMELSARARFQIKAVKKRLGEAINNVLKNGETLVLEPIGNHCRGTAFLNNNHLITNQLERVFDQICNEIDGFHYGRFDLKVDTIDHLMVGKNIKIMELNGVSSDPGHIYDPNYKLLKAYAEIAKHWKILADISIAQQNKGIKPIPINILWPVVKEHFW